MARVLLRGVTKRYGSKDVVRAIDLDISDGEFVVLVGPSGCGKSTTLRMIAGLEEISDGELFIGERRVNDVAPKDRDIAMVFQSYALYPHMTVRENMAFGLRMRRMPPAEIAARVDEAARWLGLEALLERRPAQMSGGQRQRVAMGRAIVRQPAVFLFDEPLSNLDAQLRGQMRAEIARLHRRLKTTVVYVTHDQIEAMTLADRLVVMKDGFVQQVGRPLELYERPANRFVAGFIGSPQMNFLERPVEGGRVLVGGAGFVAPPSVDRVVVGIRPEDVSFVSASSGAVQATVELVEPLGAEAHVTLSVDGEPLLARLESRRLPQEGAEVFLSVQPERLHFFSTDGDGAALANPGAPQGRTEAA